MPDDRKKLLQGLADCALQLWALTQALSREPDPNWEGIANVIGDEAAKLVTLSEEARSRVVAG